MKWAILLVFILVIQSAMAFDYYYNVHLFYKDGKLSLKSAEVKPQLDKEESTTGDYSYKVLGLDGDILYRSDFQIPTTIIYDTINPETGVITGGGEKTLEEVDVILRIPYYKNARNIEFYKNKEKLLTVSVGQFSKEICGDGICQSFETYKTCIKDCSSGQYDNYCDKLKDNICDPDCAKDDDADCVTKLPTVEKKQGIGRNVWIVLVVIVALIILAIVKWGGSKK